LNPSSRVEIAIREGEGLTVEFKEKYTSRIDEDMVAFANGRGGTVLLGVRDDGSVPGEKLTNELKARINSLARNCKPEIAVAFFQSGPVVVIEVPEGREKPHSCGSGFYRRMDATTQKMSHEEIRAMFSEHEPLPFEERTVKGFAFAQVSKEKIKAFIDEADIRLPRISAPEFLQSLKVADPAAVKIAGILFFARDVSKFIPQARTTLLAFKGVEKFQIYDRQDVHDDLLTQFSQTITFLKKHLNLRSEIKGVDRHDSYEIPLEALREAVVNALMHRDYSITGTQVSVEIYDDRVEIINPGGLPAGLPRRSFGAMSVRRNELISDLFFRLHKVERVGMGIAKMKAAMIAAGLKAPKFETKGLFQAVFYRPKVKAAVVAEKPSARKTESKGSPNGPPKGSPKGPRKTSQKGAQKGTQKGAQKGVQKTRERILELIQNNPSITMAELSQQLNRSQSAIKKNLRLLKAKGIIKRVGPDKGGHWQST
jgi:ATP-dependent DNA helicase RecG